MDRNNSNYGHNPNFPNNSNFQFNQSNPPVDPNMLNNPQIQAAFFQWCSSQPRPTNFNNIPPMQSNFPQNSQSYQQSFGNTPFFPISEHLTQNMNQSPGGVCSSNATPIELSGEHVEEFAGAQHLEEIDNDEVEIVPEVQLNNTSAQRKNQAWTIAEDKALVSAYINAGGDVERGTKTKRSGLWAEIHNQYEKARAENLNEIKVRNVKSLQNRWDHINLHVSKWVDAYGYHFRTKGSGESEQNLERFAHIDYKATNNKMFCYLHCFAILRNYPKWDPSLSKVQSDMLPGGQASTDSGGSGKRSQPDSQCEVGGRAKRPFGIKQTKMKGKASSTSSSVNLDSLNTNFNEMGEKLGELGERLLDQMKERDEEQKARVEEKKRQKEEAMKFRMLERLMQKPVLDDKELAMYNKLRDEFSSRFSL